MLSKYLEKTFGYHCEYIIPREYSWQGYDKPPYYGLEFKVRDLFRKYKKLNEKDIYKLLKEYPKEEIRKRIFMELTYYGSLLQTLEDDFTYTYEYVEEKNLRKSGYTRHHFETNIAPNNHFLLISDTHIGSEIADFDLINYIYDYAVSNNISLVFHLGDVFQKFTRREGYDSKKDFYHTSEDGGVDYSWCANRYDEYDERIKLFLDNYPNIPEVKTIAILGNHDMEINELYHNHPEEIDLRALNLINPNFFFSPHDNLSWDNGPTSIRFSHCLYLNGLYRKTWLHNAEELNSWYITMINIEEDYNLLISGHLHKSLITYVNHDRNLLISVPSTSKVNIDDIAAFECQIDEEKNIFITPLEYSKNKITTGKKLVRKL